MVSKTSANGSGSGGSGRGSAVDGIDNPRRRRRRSYPSKGGGTNDAIRTCVNCCRNKATRLGTVGRRLLCQTCFLKPAVRQQWAAESSRMIEEAREAALASGVPGNHIGYLGGYQHNGRSEVRPLPPKPTRYMPGTVDKVEEMRWRLWNGYQLYHPSDPTIRDMVMEMVRSDLSPRCGAYRLRERE